MSERAGRPAPQRAKRVGRQATAPQAAEASLAGVPQSTGAHQTRTPREQQRHGAQSDEKSTRQVTPREHSQRRRFAACSSIQDPVESSYCLVSRRTRQLWAHALRGEDVKVPPRGTALVAVWPPCPPAHLLKTNRRARTKRATNDPRNGPLVRVREGNIPLRASARSLLPSGTLPPTPKHRPILRRPDGGEERPTKKEAAPRLSSSRRLCGAAQCAADRYRPPSGTARKHTHARTGEVEALRPPNVPRGR